MEMSKLAAQDVVNFQQGANNSKALWYVLVLTLTERNVGKTILRI